MADRAFTPPASATLRSVSQNLLTGRVIKIEKKVFPDTTQLAPRLPSPRPPGASEPAVAGGAARVLEQVIEIEDPLEAVLNGSWRQRAAKPPPAAADTHKDALDAAVESAAKTEELVEARAAEVPGAAAASSVSRPASRGALRRRASCPTLTIATPYTGEGERIDRRTPTAPPLSPRFEGERIGRRTPPAQGPECDGPGSRCSSRPCTATSREEAVDAMPPDRALQRRYTFQFEDLENDILSPAFMPPKQRTGCCKISSREVLSPSTKPSEVARFQGMVKNVETLVNQAAVRINDHLGGVRRRLGETPDMFENPTNRSKLENLSFMLAVVNYRLSKWLHQLAPEKHPMPKKPTRRDDSPYPRDLLAEVSLACSRMELVVSLFAPMMQRIVSDASTQRFPAGPGLLPPVGFRDPIKVAEERGMTNISELDALPLHLEHALQLSSFLAHSPLQAGSVGSAADVMVAVGRFKGALRRRASM